MSCKNIVRLAVAREHHLVVARCDTPSNGQTSNILIEHTMGKFEKIILDSIATKKLGDKSVN